MTDLTEAIARHEHGTHDPRDCHAHFIPAARKWADLEALIADGGRVVVEKDCNQVDCKCERRIVLGEGATDAV